MVSRTALAVITIAGGALAIKLISDADRAEAEGSGGIVVPFNFDFDSFLPESSPTPTVPPPATGGGVPTPSDVGPAYARAPGFVQAVIRASFERKDYEAMAAIAECESSFVPTAWNQNGEDSRGHWQINIGPGANTDMRHRDLFDPFQNGEAARIILDRQGYRAWFHCSKRNGLI